MFIFNLNFIVILLIIASVFILASWFVVYQFKRFAKNAKGPTMTALSVGGKKTLIDEHVENLANKTNGLGLKHDALRALSNNLDAFTARATTAYSAGRSLDLMYYIWENDLTGRLLLKEVLNAADRGVRVRLLLDDMYTHGHDPALLTLDQHPNINIRLFNPGRARNGYIRRGLEMMLRALSTTRRMHNKAFIVDGRIAFVGGRNIGDSYFDAGQNSNYRDLDLMLIGPSVKDVENIFDNFWNSNVVLPIHKLNTIKQKNSMEKWRENLNAFVASDKAKPYISYIHDYLTLKHLLSPKQDIFPASSVQVLSDPPEKALGKNNENWMMKSFQPLMEGAKEKLIITSPYFVPGTAGTNMLCHHVKNKVDVRILTNSLAATDVIAVHGGYAPYRKKLLQGGVKIFELKPDNNKRNKLHLFGSKRASLHTKAFSIDDKICFVGSFNFDPRSASLNTEMGILFVCEPVMNSLKTLYAQETSEDSSYSLTLTKNNKLQWQSIINEKIVTVTHEPEPRLWRRLLSKIIGWLPIESQL